MKTKDLMMSDFYWWEAEGKKYPLQVTKDTFKLEDEDIANFEPIPITEEFLEKNFEFEESKSLYNSYRLQLSDEECIFIDFNKKRKYIRITYDNDRVCGTTIIILQNFYIHELQHALRLVGLSEISDNLKV